jgi:hypothetical protein
MIKTSLKHVHRDQHAGKVEILVDGEVIDNVLEAQEDEWYTVELCQPDHSLKEMFIIAVRTECRNVKIFEITEEKI